ncbi:MAG: sugar phosphate nucleotidyltransferase [Ignavibacteriaceae bacterium]|nr:sugar phosphate nucleotidyltransferase [Ignavibacteriaceae bacterium]
MLRENFIRHNQQMSSYNNILWGVVLAGGEGTRLKNLVKRLYGYPRPKQYCTLTGTYSLINQTILRVSKIISNKNILTVVNRNHFKYYKDELRSRPVETIVVQPCPRGTCAGILLPVAKIHKTNPDSIVAIFPSDHFIQEENKFINYIKEASIFVERNPDLIVLAGIRPIRIETGLGWIESGYKINSFNDLNFSQIRNFCEKPDAAVTSSLFASGCLINTSIVIGKSRTIIEQMKKHLPLFFEAFNPIYDSLGTKHEKDIIKEYFKLMPDVNFSKDFLENVADQLAVLEIPDVYWSDWGEEQRITYDLKKFHLSFPSKIISHKGTMERLHEASRTKIMRKTTVNYFNSDGSRRIK